MMTIIVIFKNEDSVFQWRCSAHMTIAENKKKRVNGAIRKIDAPIRGDN